VFTASGEHFDTLQKAALSKDFKSVAASTTAPRKIHAGTLENR
jgi:hypothetical protein